MIENLVSVIIPTYNRAYCIERAIDSAAAQTHRELEILVVDDGSTDGTDELIRRRYAADPRVRCIRQPNSGVSGARNTGLRAARGEYVALLDSDDSWKPWKLELQLRCLSRVPQAGMIWTDMEAFDSSGKLVSERYLRRMYSAYRWFTAETLFTESAPAAALCPDLGPAKGATLYWGDIFSPMVMGNLVHTSTVLIRRSRQQAVGGFNEQLKYSGEDYEFHLRTCRQGPVAFVDVASIEYRVGADDQLTHDRHEIDNARNVVTTVAPVIELERDRIKLPPAMLATRQAAINARLGRAELDAGDRRGARRHLFASLRHRPAQPRVAVFFGFACAPGFAYPLARRLVRAVKRLAGLKGPHHAFANGARSPS